jgi:hypothetical protein
MDYLQNQNITVIFDGNGAVKMPNLNPIEHLRVN